MSSPGHEIDDNLTGNLDNHRHRPVGHGWFDSCPASDGFCGSLHSVTHFPMIRTVPQEGFGHVAQDSSNPRASPAACAHAQATCSSTPSTDVCVITTANLVTTNANPNVTYAWDNPAIGNKGLAIGTTCASGKNGFIIIIKDEIGTAGTYPIIVTTAGGNTIDGAAQFMLNSNFESITLQCDSTSNWLVE
jgi:hypothetical protein